MQSIVWAKRLCIVDTLCNYQQNMPLKLECHKWLPLICITSTRHDNSCYMKQDTRRREKKKTVDKSQRNGKKLRLKYVKKNSVLNFSKNRVLLLLLVGDFLLLSTKKKVSRRGTFFYCCKILIWNS